MIYVIVTINFAAESMDEVRAAAAACREATLKEDGCISYEMLTPLDNPNQLVIVENWTSRETLAAHGKQPHMDAWRSVSRPLTLSRKSEKIFADNVEKA